MQVDGLMQPPPRIQSTPAPLPHRHDTINVTIFIVKVLIIIKGKTTEVNSPVAHVSDPAVREITGSERCEVRFGLRCGLGVLTRRPILD